MPRPDRIPPNTDDVVWSACWSAKNDDGTLIASTHRRIHAPTINDATIIAERYATTNNGWTLAGVYLADHRDHAPFLTNHDERITP